MAHTFTALAILLALSERALPFCHELEVVQGRVYRAALSSAPALTIEWLGHSTFQITSSKGTRVLTDPHGAFDLPRPTLPQHIVTTSHRHGPHSSVHMAPGTPVIFHGLTPGGEDWQKISTTVRDVSVYVVPAYHDKSRGSSAARTPSSSFAWTTSASPISAISAMCSDPTSSKRWARSTSCSCRSPAATLP